MANTYNQAQIFNNSNTVGVTNQTQKTFPKITISGSNFNPHKKDQIINQIQKILSQYRV